MSMLAICKCMMHPMFNTWTLTNSSSTFGPQQNRSLKHSKRLRFASLAPLIVDPPKFLQDPLLKIDLQTLPNEFDNGSVWYQIGECRF